MSQTELDPYAILRELGLTTDVTVSPVSGGSDTAIWRVEHAGAVYALRVFRPEQRAVSRREVEAMRAAAQGGVPVPQVYGDTVWRERPALLLGWISGAPLLHELLQGPRPAWTVGVAFGQMQALIHRVRAPQLLQTDPHRWLTWLGPEETALQRRLHAQKLDATALLHLDYHPLNVMTSGAQVTGVLDWANVAAGDPRFDMARTISILRLAPLPPTLPVDLVHRGRRALIAGWKYGYQAVAGPIDDMAPFYAWAGIFMWRDLRPKLGHPGTGIEQRHLDRIKRWTQLWKYRAGAA